MLPGHHAAGTWPVQDSSPAQLPQLRLSPSSTHKEHAAQIETSWNSKVDLKYSICTRQTC